MSKHKNACGLCNFHSHPGCGSGHHPGRVVTGVSALSIIIIIIRIYAIPDLSSQYTEF